MSEPLTQVFVESEIMRLSGLAEKVTHVLSQRAQAAEARTAQKVAYAKAYLVTSGTVGERDAQVTVDTAELLLAKEIAEAMEKAAQEAGRNYRAQLDSLRSINANMRALVTG